MGHARRLNRAGMAAETGSRTDHDCSRPCFLTYEGVTRNRQQKNDVIDPQVGALRIEERDGRKTIATLFNFTGHPVILGSTNLMLSGK
jgi:hypothetical protein